MTPPPRVALFGKLPRHGDFVRRGDPALVQRLDGWLSGEVDRLAADSGDAVDAMLMRLPIWCFVLADGVAGALVASSDRVGRVFPLVACVDGDGAAARRVADAIDPHPAPRPDADALAAALAAVAVMPGEAAAPAGWWRADGGGRPLPAGDLPRGAAFLHLFEEGDRCRG